MGFKPHAPRPSAIMSRLAGASSEEQAAAGPRVLRVLLVDDDPEVTPLVASALHPFGMELETAASGEEAIRRLEDRDYELVVLDLNLNGVSGYDVLNAMKAQLRHRRIPVLILTGNDSHEALARSFGYGADDLVTKPFDPELLGLRAFRLACPPVFR